MDMMNQFMPLLWPSIGLVIVMGREPNRVWVHFFHYVMFNAIYWRLWDIIELMQ